MARSKMPQGLTEWLKRVIWALALLAVLFCVWRLEQERDSVDSRGLSTEEGMVTLYQSRTVPQGPLVVVTHGFAGSLQMMQYISRDLARAGFTVAAFDFYGHGRNPTRLSRDVTRIEGTTQQLVDQTSAVVAALARAPFDDGLALLGHSMATDIIIRAARPRQDVAAIVAISMYSEAVTAEFPQRLLVISGEWEERLRRVGREVVAQVSPQGVEGQTVRAGEVHRRAAYTPFTEHVAVLFAADTLDETRAWLQAAFALPTTGEAWPRGPLILLLLTGLVVLSAPVARLLPAAAHETPPRLSTRVYLLALVLPALPAALAAIILGGSVLGLASFGSLLWFFGVWGAVSLAVMLRAGQRLRRPDWRGVALLLIWALGVFALALDRYAAAFLPVGPRLGLMLLLLPACVLFAVADRLLVRGAALWQRAVARVLPVAVLTACMLVAPERLGLLFTVLPVMVLFYGVYGTMARFVSLRQGVEGAGVALGVVLAWSIAASTPLFQG